MRLPFEPHPNGKVIESGVSGELSSDKVVNVNIHSRLNRFKFSLCANVVQQIPYRVPDRRRLPIDLSLYKLADDELP